MWLRRRTSGAALVVLPSNERVPLTIRSRQASTKTIERCAADDAITSNMSAVESIVAGLRTTDDAPRMYPLPSCRKPCVATARMRMPSRPASAVCSRSAARMPAASAGRTSAPASRNARRRSRDSDFTGRPESASTTRRGGTRLTRRSSAKTYARSMASSTANGTSATDSLLKWRTPTNSAADCFRSNRVLALRGVSISTRTERALREANGTTTVAVATPRSTAPRASGLHLFTL